MQSISSSACTPFSVCASGILTGSSLAPGMWQVFRFYLYPERVRTDVFSSIHAAEKTNPPVICTLHRWNEAGIPRALTCPLIHLEGL